MFENMLWGLMNKGDVEAVGFLAKIAGVVIVSLAALAFCYGSLNRVYEVWAQRKAGEAELARAESNRQIKTLEAKAAQESARYLADAEVVRAQGVAKANQIIGDSLSGNESYLRYLWIQGLQTNNMQVVYVPTEANLPLLEAGRIRN